MNLKKFSQVYVVTLGIEVEVDKVKVVVRYSDGRLMKGFTQDFSPKKVRFHLISSENPSGQTTAVFMSELKAVFMVRDFIGDPLHEERKKYIEGEESFGRKMEVTFKDGEVLVGSTLGYSSTQQGFFIFPADSNGNNAKVYVVSSAVDKVRYL